MEPVVNMEPFKNWFSPGMAQGIAANLARVSDQFDEVIFTNAALKGLDKLELKQRSEQFSMAIEAAMSGSFEENVSAMLSALHPNKTAGISEMRTDDTGLAGWALMPITAYIARNGLDTPEFSLRALREMTMRSSSEFDVRPFLRDHPALTLNVVKTWAQDENVHVRRLASEGSRPRLPWGIRLHGLVEDPSPLLPILTALRDDPSEYVRRSVANNLNDIAKDHPDLVAGLALDWLVDASPERKRLVKHACRTLIKQGHAGALAAFGFTTPDLLKCEVSVGAEAFNVGDTMDISLSLSARGGPQRLLIDYVIHFMRANGRLSPKVFKWTEITLAQGENLMLNKAHKYRKVTTRKDYPGLQRLTVQINGQDMGGPEFELSL